MPLKCCTKPAGHKQTSYSDALHLSAAVASVLFWVSTQPVLERR